MGLRDALGLLQIKPNVERVMKRQQGSCVKTLPEARCSTRITQATSRGIKMKGGRPMGEETQGVSVNLALHPEGDDHLLDSDSLLLHST